MINTYYKSKDGNRFLAVNFQVKEFACKDGKTDTVLINSDLPVVLQRLYDFLNNKYGIKSVNISSSYRTPEWSVHVGGTSKDEHTKGNASDIFVKLKNGKLLSSKEICLAMEDMGYTSGGVLIINDNYVHIDVRGKKIYYDERNKKSFNSFYEYFGITKSTNKKYIQINTSGGVWCRKGLGFKYSKYILIPHKTKCELIKQNSGTSNGYKWDKIIYNGVTVYLPNKWNKYI